VKLVKQESIDVTKKFFPISCQMQFSHYRTLRTDPETRRDLPSSVDSCFTSFTSSQQPEGISGFLIQRKRYIVTQGLEPFRPDATCAKCGGEAVSAAWHPCAVAGERCFKGTSAQRVAGEHICRRCDRCGHGWCELPLDGGEAAVAMRPLDS
jgi:hypothetical protein